MLDKTNERNYNTLMRMYVILATLLLSGCVSMSTHRDFVDASDKFYQYVAEDYIARVNNDNQTPDISKKNAQKTLDRYLQALEEAKKRAGL